MRRDFHTRRNAVRRLLLRRRRSDHRPNRRRPRHGLASPLQPGPSSPCEGGPGSFSHPPKGNQSCPKSTTHSPGTSSKQTASPDNCGSGRTTHPPGIRASSTGPATRRRHRRRTPPRQRRRNRHQRAQRRARRRHRGAAGMGRVGRSACRRQRIRPRDQRARYPATHPKRRPRIEATSMSHRG